MTFIHWLSIKQLRMGRQNIRVRIAGNTTREFLLPSLLRGKSPPSRQHLFHLCSMLLDHLLASSFVFRCLACCPGCPGCPCRATLGTLANQLLITLHQFQSIFTIMLLIFSIFKSLLFCHQKMDCKMIFAWISHGFHPFWDHLGSFLGRWAYHL